MTAVHDTAASTPAPTTSAADLLAERYGAAHAAELSGPEPGEVLRHQLAHRSVRAFRSEPVSEDAVTAIVAAAQSAPSSSNLQTWSVVVVRDPEHKSRLATLAGDQEFIREAPVFLVWLVDFARLDQLAGQHGHGLDGADYVESAVQGFVDVGLAAQNGSLAAESLGLGTVFVGAIRNNPEQVADELGLPPRVVAAFGLAVGYPDPERPARIKPRLPQDAVAHPERYRSDTQLPAIAEYETTIGAFYESEGLAHSWKERVLARLGTVAGLKGRDRARESLQNLGFPLR